MAIDDNIEDENMMMLTERNYILSMKVLQMIYILMNIMILKNIFMK